MNNELTTILNKPVKLSLFCQINEKQLVFVKIIKISNSHFYIKRLLHKIAIHITTDYNLHA